MEGSQHHAGPEGPAWLIRVEKLSARNRGDFLLVRKNGLLIGQNCFLVGENFIQDGLVFKIVAYCGGVFSDFPGW